MDHEGCLASARQRVSAPKPRKIFGRSKFQRDQFQIADQTSVGSGSGGNSLTLKSHGAGMQGDSSDSNIYVPSDHRWSAAVNWNFGHGYRIHGEASDFDGIAASGSSISSASAFGATCSVQIDKNELLLLFICAEPVDLVNCGSAPIATNLAPGNGVIFDTAAIDLKAFYVLGPAGGPAPWSFSP